MENNLENKARFFAQYLGSKICYPDTDNKIIKAKLTSVGFDEIQTTYFRRKKHSAGYTVGDILSFNPTNVFHNSDAKNAYLELTPLSEISDEDAIEVAKIVSSSINCKYYKRNLKSDYWCYVSCLNTNAEVRIWFNSCKISFCNVYETSVSLIDGNILQAYDYLLSKGIALPFHDLSVEDLINYGWIKLKTK